MFLDSDDLSDLRDLLEHVKASEVLVLLQSGEVLTRPWVLLELYTAVTNDVPIVALHVADRNYDFHSALDLLEHLDTELDRRNPGAAEMLLDFGVDILDVAYRLSETLPNIISGSFNPYASRLGIQAAVMDLVESFDRAKPLPPVTSKQEWQERRSRHDQRRKREQQQQEEAWRRAESTCC